MFKKLYDLGQRQGNADAIATRLRQQRERHGRKPSLIKRLDQAGFPK